MKTKLLALALLGGSSLFAETRFSVGINVGGYPPPPRVAYAAPPCPGPDYAWIDGYYAQVGPRRVWHAGYWATDRTYAVSSTHGTNALVFAASLSLSRGSVHAVTEPRATMLVVCR
jgi:hypothetical protein